MREEILLIRDVNASSAAIVEPQLHYAADGLLNTVFSLPAEAAEMIAVLLMSKCDLLFLLPWLLFSASIFDLSLVEVIALLMTYVV